jgi:hypothetical protein
MLATYPSIWTTAHRPGALCLAAPAQKAQEPRSSCFSSPCLIIHLQSGLQQTPVITFPFACVLPQIASPFPFPEVISRLVSRETNIHSDPSLLIWILSGCFGCLSPASFCPRRLIPG